MTKTDKNKIPWNKGTKGKCKPNSGSFKKESIPWNKDVSGYSNSNKGKPRNPASGYQDGHKNFHIGGNKWSEESRIKLSMTQTGDNEFVGFKSILRRRLMGASKYIKWRADVFKRDNYHCQNCGEKGYLEAHHIIPYSKIIKEFNIVNMKDAVKCKELWNIGNGISYCKSCHILLDTNRGKRGLSKIGVELNLIGGNKMGETQ